VITEEPISADRARGMTRMLYLTLGVGVALVLLGLGLVAKSNPVYGAIVVGIAVVVGACGVLALRMLQTGAPPARRWSIATGVLLVVLSVPLIPIWVGLLTAVFGIGLLVVVVAPEKEAP
jgi:hypothetical protein